MLACGAAVGAERRDHGATVHFRQQAARIHVKQGRATEVTTQKGLTVNADRSGIP